MKKTRRSRPALDLALPPPEQLAGGDFVFEACDPSNPGAKRARNRSPFALDAYRNRGQLDPRDAERNELRWEAGDRLRASWTIAGLDPRVTARYAEWVSGMGEGSGADETVNRRRALRDALEAAWPYATVLLDCCCLGHAVGRTRMDDLRDGLDVLVEHYGLRRGNRRAA